MARPVYSVRLLDDSGVTGDRSYTVPDGYTLVIRQVAWFSQVGIGVPAYNYAYGPSGGTFLWFTVDTDTTVMQQFEGRWVFIEGEVVTFHSDDATDLHVSGYLLSD
jgi:hypothetical protein